jgi:hypothetical protein
MPRWGLLALLFVGGCAHDERSVRLQASIPILEKVCGDSAEQDLPGTHRREEWDALIRDLAQTQTCDSPWFQVAGVTTLQATVPRQARVLLLL